MRTESKVTKVEKILIILTKADIDSLMRYEDRTVYFERTEVKLSYANSKSE